MCYSKVSLALFLFEMLAKSLNSFKFLHISGSSSFSLFFSLPLMLFSYRAEIIRAFCSRSVAVFGFKLRLFLLPFDFLEWYFGLLLCAA